MAGVSFKEGLAKITEADVEFFEDESGRWAEIFEFGPRMCFMSGVNRDTGKVAYDRHAVGRGLESNYGNSKEELIFSLRQSYSLRDLPMIIT